VVEDDSILEKSEFQIGEAVTFVSDSGDFFKGAYEVIGRVSDEASSVSFARASFSDRAVETG
jgi:hypothetical protein